MGIVTRDPIATSSTFAHGLKASIALTAASCSMLFPVSPAIATTSSTTPTDALSTGGFLAPSWVSSDIVPTTPAFAPVTARSTRTICVAVNFNWASALGAKVAVGAVNWVAPGTGATASVATATGAARAPQSSALLLLV